MSAPYLDDGDVVLHLGDCVEVMAAMEPESVDAVVCDPPYLLGFMGREWDRGFVSFDPATWREALRVLKPGGHLLAFGGSRTFHRLTCAIEDAGFEVRDCLSWLYGSGFPKSLDVSKAIDKRRDDRADIEHVVRFLEGARVASGVTRVKVEARFGTVNIGQGFFTITPGSMPRVPPWDQWLTLKDLIGFGDEMDAEVWRLNGRKGQPGEAWDQREVVGESESGLHRGSGATVSFGEGRDRRVVDITAPATPEAAAWQGWGTALKPAWEPVVLARKPLVGTVAANVLRHGTGALNVDGCRVVKEPGDRTEYGLTNGAPAGIGYHGLDGRTPYDGHAGRWPANVVLDEEAAARLDAEVGELPTQRTRTNPERPYGEGAGVFSGLNNRHGVEYLGDTGGPSRFFYTAKASSAERDGATHPTVKPLALMRWLVRLVTPPGGVVLDPFAGSGTTLLAARDEGFRSIGIEREAEYAAMAAHRLRQLSLLGGVG